MRTVNNDERSQLESSEANSIHLNAGNRLRSSCIPPDNTVPHGGQTESLRGRSGPGLQLMHNEDPLISDGHGSHYRDTTVSCSSSLLDEYHRHYRDITASSSSSLLDKYHRHHRDITVSSSSSLLGGHDCHREMTAPSSSSLLDEHHCHYRDITAPSSASLRIEHDCHYRNITAPSSFCTARWTSPSLP